MTAWRVIESHTVFLAKTKIKMKKSNRSSCFAMKRVRTEGANRGGVSNFGAALGRFFAVLATRKSA